MITWQVQRFAKGVEWKIESEVNRLQPDISNSRNVQVYELQPFWDKHSSVLKFQLIEKGNTCAHLSKCSAVWCRAKEEIKDGFLSCRTEFLADVSKTLRQVQVYEVQPYWDKVLNFKLIEKCNSCAHLCKCFVEWCRATETNIMAAARTDFIDELL